MFCFNSQPFEKTCRFCSSSHEMINDRRSFSESFASQKLLLDRESKSGRLSDTETGSTDSHPRP